MTQDNTPRWINFQNGDSATTDMVPKPNGDTFRTGLDDILSTPSFSGLALLLLLRSQSSFEIRFKGGGVILGHLRYKRHRQKKRPPNTCAKRTASRNSRVAAP